MVRDCQFTVKFVSYLLAKIDVVKFNDPNNFEMWRCEMMDALMAPYLEDTQHLKENQEEHLKRTGTR